MNEETPRLSRAATVVCCVLLAVAGLSLRAPDLRQGLQIDEQMWLDRAYDLLRQARLSDSLDGYKPGFDVSRCRCVEFPGRPFPLDIAIRAHHPGYLSTLAVAGTMKLALPRDPTIEDLIRVRWLQSVVLTAYAVACFLLLQQAFGFEPLTAVAFALFVLSEPALLAESRLIKQDVLITTSLTLCVFCFAAFLNGRSKAWLWASAVAGGAVCATKVAFLPVVLGSFLILIVLALRRRRKVDLLTVLAWGALCYACAFVVSPNVWPRPFLGYGYVLRTALRSPQASLGRPGPFENLVAFLATFKHLSMLLPAVLVAAVIFLARRPSPTRLYVAACAAVCLAINYFSAVKSPRYVLPAVPLVLFLGLQAFPWMPGRLRTRALVAFIVVSCALHAVNYAGYYPYHAVYTWEFAEKTPNVRLTRSILMPQIADELRRRGARQVWVRTGKETLRHYYDGDARELRKWRDGWLLVSEKYYGLIPPDAGPPEKVFRFRGQEIYRLYRVPSPRHPAR